MERTGTPVDLGNESRTELELMVMKLREEVWRMIPILRAEGYVRRHQSGQEFDWNNANDWVKGENVVKPTRITGREEG